TPARPVAEGPHGPAAVQRIEIARPHLIRTCLSPHQRILLRPQSGWSITVRYSPHFLLSTEYLIMATITDVSSVAGAKTVRPIPPLVNQVGATCGLYALSCVIRYWHQLLTDKGQTPAWQPPDERGPENAKTLREKLNDEIKARAGKPSANPTKFTGVTTPTNL